jgi:hypothetical protein
MFSYLLPSLWQVVRQEVVDLENHIIKNWKACQQCDTCSSKATAALGNFPCWRAEETIEPRANVRALTK